MAIHTIIVCGAGTMGSGIAQLAARYGHNTYLYDLDAAALERGRANITGAFQGLVDKGRLPAADRDEALSRLHFTNVVPGRQADLVIEAIVERLDAKIGLLNSLRQDSAILASNTSSLSIDALQNALPNPERVAGLHFFNPAPVMKLVEVVRGARTDASVSAALQELMLAWGKTPVLCKDAPGFIVNRVARPYYLEALRLVESGGTDYAAIDRICEATGFRMGPFRLMDLIGNDINLAVTRSLFEASGKARRFTPSRLQEDVVARGDLGRKTGKGYYTYAN